MDISQIADSLVALEKDQARYEEYQKQILTIRAQFDRKKKQSSVMADLIEKHFGSIETKKVNLNNDSTLEKSFKLFFDFLCHIVCLDYSACFLSRQ